MIISFSRSVFPSNAHTRSHPHQRSLLIILGKSRILNLLNIHTFFSSSFSQPFIRIAVGRVAEWGREKLCMRVDWETRAEGADTRARDCVQALPPISRRVNMTKKNRSFSDIFLKSSDFRLHSSKFASSLRNILLENQKKKKRKRISFLLTNLLLVNFVPWLCGTVARHKRSDEWIWSSVWLDWMEWEWNSIRRHPKIPSKSTHPEKPSLSRKGMENNRLTEKRAREIGEDKGNKFFH